MDNLSQRPEATDTPVADAMRRIWVGPARARNLRPYLRLSPYRPAQRGTWVVAAACWVVGVSRWARPLPRERQGWLTAGYSPPAAWVRC